MNKCNILLINPWIYDFAAYDFWLKPVGLLSLASILRKFGYQIELIDCLDRFHPAFKEINLRNVQKYYGTGKFHREIIEKPAIFSFVPRYYARYGLPIDLFQQELDRVTPPEVVLVTSGMTYWYPGVFKAIELVKQKWPDVPVILGGIYATLCFSHAQQNAPADFVLPGPGELAVLQLVDRLTSYTRDYTEFPQALDGFPYPAYDLYPTLASVPVITSRGCPFRCPFCASPILSPAFEQREPEAVIREIEYYYHQFGVTEFAFWDDALLINPEQHFKKILKGLVKRRLKAHFHLPNGIHPRLMHPEIAELMAECDFRTIRLSFESADTHRQKQMSSKVSNQNLIDGIAFLKQAGYAGKNLDVYLLMGLPDQSMDEIWRSIDFVHRLGVAIRMSSFSPIPGTEEWKKAVEQHGFPADADPLLSNNSVFPLYRTQKDFERFEQLKLEVRKLNDAL